MIYIDINKTNEVFLTLSQNINTCGNYLFEFVPVNKGEKIYIKNDNISLDQSKFDLFEIIDDESITPKNIYINEPTNMDNGQYTVNIYDIGDSDFDVFSPENIIYNKIYTTKGVVNIKEVIKNKYK